MKFRPRYASQTLEALIEADLEGTRVWLQAMLQECDGIRSRLAKRLGIDNKYAGAILDRLGIAYVTPEQRPTPRRDALLQVLMDVRGDRAKAAERLGISKGRVKTLCRAFGLDPLVPHHTDPYWSPHAE